MLSKAILYVEYIHHLDWGLKMKIKYSPNVIGCRIGDEIYLNPALKECPKLYTAILKHEKNHSSGLRLKDLKMDLNNNELKGVKKEYYTFLLKHPKSLLSFLPISKVGKHWCFDVSSGLIWAFALFVFVMVLIT